jgi:hypothetical protein
LQWIDGFYYAGGGGGTINQGAPTPGVPGFGGLGGGGTQTYGFTENNYSKGQINTGGGGAGAGAGPASLAPTGSKGGSGVVIIGYRS